MQVCPMDTHRKPKANSQAAVEASERVGKHERHDQNARTEDEHVPGFAQIEVAYSTDE